MTEKSLKTILIVIQLRGKMAPGCLNCGCLSSNVKSRETLYGFSSLFHGHLGKKMTGVEVRVVGRSECEEDQHECSYLVNLLGINIHDLGC